MDAAALASTAPLDLSDAANAPDFVALSFYKIFGFPNIGALIVRKDSAHVLAQRKYFGGGTVDMIITMHDTWHAMKETALHDRLEDGTLPFHSIFALDHAMNVHERLYGPNPMKFISTHTAQLGKILYDGLSALKHGDGSAVCVIYKDESAVYGDPVTQGATVAFNVIRGDGSMVGYEEVEEAADERNIFIRSGSLCNPGGMASYLGWSPAEMRAAYASGHRCTNPTQIMFGRPTGVVRVSLGAMSTASDVRTLLRFLEETYVERGQASTATLVQALQMAPARSVHMPKPPSPSASTFPPPRLPPLNPISTHGLGLSGMPSPVFTAASGFDSLNGGADSHPDSGIVMNERPRFIPSEYTKRYKPWEEAIRKTSYTNVGVGIQVRELDTGSMSKAQTPPSVKARKFGRSVVNLLRSKNVNQEQGQRYASIVPPSV